MENSEEIDDPGYSGFLFLEPDAVISVEDSEQIIIDDEGVVTTEKIPILSIPDGDFVIEDQSLESATIQESVVDENGTVIRHLYRIVTIPHEESGEGTSVTISDQNVFSNNAAPAPQPRKKGSIKKKPIILRRPKSHHCLEPGCDRSYTSLPHLKVHARAHKGLKPFQCTIEGCPKAFSTLYSRTAHIRTHTGERPYSCTFQECGKEFGTSGDLLKHVRTHTGERPFKCTFEGCDKAFTTSNNRQVHMRSHTGERPFECDQCSRRFATFTNCKNHMRIHSGEKPFACKVEGCGKRFTEYSSLHKHQAVHNQKIRYDCSVCGKSYRHMSSLNIHFNTNHPEVSSKEITESDLAQLLQTSNLFSLKKMNGAIIKLETEDTNSSSPVYFVDYDLPGITFEGSGFESYETNDSIE